MNLSGPNHGKLLVTSDGKLVAEFDQEYSPEAHSLQIGLIWIHGMNYTGKPKSEKDRKIKYFFEFTSYFLWDLQPNSGSRKKRACPRVQDLWDLIHKKPRDPKKA